VWLGIPHSHHRRADTNAGLHVKYPFFLSNFNLNCNVSANFCYPTNMEFHENPFNNSQVVIYSRIDKAKQLSFTNAGLSLEGREAKQST